MRGKDKNEKRDGTLVWLAYLQLSAPTPKLDVSPSRCGLRHPGDRCSAEHLLHCCVSLGHLLPVQLLHLGSALGFLQQYLEHRWDTRHYTYRIRSSSTKQIYSVALIRSNQISNWMPTSVWSSVMRQTFWSRKNHLIQNVAYPIYWLTTKVFKNNYFPISLCV